MKKKDIEAIKGSVIFDFILMINKHIKENNIQQKDIARKIGCTQGYVSQILNEYYDNLTVESLIKLAGAIGMKIAIVPYESPSSAMPVFPAVFTTLWEKAGRPTDYDDVIAVQVKGQ